MNTRNFWKKTKKKHRAKLIINHPESCVRKAVVILTGWGGKNHCAMEGKKHINLMSDIINIPVMTVLMLYYLQKHFSKSINYIPFNI